MQFQSVSSLFAIVALFSAMAAAAPATKRKHEYSGVATWYSPKHNGGTKAACYGEHIDDDSNIVALNAPQYGDLGSNSDWCGKKIEIEGPNGKARASILDACPECDDGSLDLTPALFTKVVGDKDIGQGDITWRVL
ncbi:hypothetical protein BDF20DRAFT_896726 [Mycotypha africana]|uniref:uncharacterized protein n=1 Tax=Mycotypha africana TaxID=64632 RepID=UPI002301441B|nr:uncharacterized protein BDF20DRAFT_896726 [Mycotypha africana]KAI8968497.1 hypothetical protein BDF20DRAFT_896726 [Mycotypha africana]